MQSMQTCECSWFAKDNRGKRSSQRDCPYYLLVTHSTSFLLQTWAIAAVWSCLPEFLSAPHSWAHFVFKKSSPLPRVFRWPPCSLLMSCAENQTFILIKGQGKACKHVPCLNYRCHFAAISPFLIVWTLTEKIHRFCKCFFLIWSSKQGQTLKDKERNPKALLLFSASDL